MQTFLEWLVNERRRELVAPEVLAGYEQGFQQALQQLMQRVQDPVLKDKFRRMLDCPIKDGLGRCRSFTDYIVSALVRHGLHKQTDAAEVLQHIYSTLMLDRKANGEPKSTVFGTFDPDRPYAAGANPLEARFKTSVANAVRNIVSGRIPRLFNTERRPQGTVSADQLPSKPNHDRDFDELLSDIKTLLKRKEAAYGMPLVAICDSMLAGRRFGGQTMARQIIVSTIRDYAKSSGNERLLWLLQRLESPTVTQAPKPAPVSTKQKDYSSILSVVDRMGGRPAGSAVLGRNRRRWLGYEPRDKASGHANRMAEVLDKMVRDGVLRSVKTGRGAQAYLPGPNAEKYRVG